MPVMLLASMKSNTPERLARAACHIGCVARCWGGGNSGPRRGQLGDAKAGGSCGVSATKAEMSVRRADFMVDQWRWIWVKESGVRSGDEVGSTCTVYPLSVLRGSLHLPAWQWSQCVWRAKVGRQQGRNSHSSKFKMWSACGFAPSFSEC